MSLGQKYAFKIFEKDLVGIEKEFLKFPIPKAGFKLPKIVGKALNKILPDYIKISPEAGLFIVIPFALEIKLKLEYEYSMEASAGYKAGQKEVQFRLVGPPSNLNADFSMIKDDPPTTENPSIVATEVEETESVRAWTCSGFCSGLDSHTPYALS